MGCRVFLHHFLDTTPKNLSKLELPIEFSYGLAEITPPSDELLKQIDNLMCSMKEKRKRS